MESRPRFERLFWWADPAPRPAWRIAAQVMLYGGLEDIDEVRQGYGDAVFSEALDRAPPGLFDPRTWVFWNKKLGRVPVPPQNRPLLWPPA
jgi:hypothetical protein